MSRDAIGDRWLRWLPLVVGGASIALLAATLLLLFVDRQHRLPPQATTWDLAGVMGVVSNLGVPMLGILISVKRPSNPIGWLFLGAAAFLALGSFGEAYAVHTLAVAPGSWPLGRLAAWASNALWPIPVTLLVLLLLLFPTGSVLTRRWRPVAVATCALGGTVFVLGSVVAIAIWSRPFANLADASARRGVSAPAIAAGSAGLVLATLGFPLLLVAALVSVVLRYRRSRGEERFQMKWFTFAAAIVVVTFAINVSNAPLLVQFLSSLALMGLWVAIGVAMLKYRLYDIDLVIRRTVVGGVLVAFVTAVYVVIVAGIGALGSRSDLLQGGPLIAAATAIVAIAFQPILRQARHLANRLVYGDRATPYEVLSEFSERMGDTLATNELPQRMATILGEGTGATTAAVWLFVGGELRPAAVWPSGTPAPPPVRAAREGEVVMPGAGRAFSVRHHGELLGALTVAMPATEPLAGEQERLCVDLASQAGLVLRNVLLIEELRASRQRLVAAQDEERRKLERNIHDGAQQQLVALAVKIRMAAQLVRRDADKAEHLLAEVGEETTDALGTLRDLAHGIYPPLLADKGLPKALEAQARKSTLAVTVDADGVGRYPQDAEAAVYFSVLEGLQNVAKYAEASRVSVRLSQTDGRLTFEVVDDGRGFDASATGYGTGLQGIADRLAALDGSLTVRSAAGQGTTLVGTVPVEPVAVFPP